jgi:hypothetical protein
MSLSAQEILIMGSGHVIIDDTSEYDTEYVFAGFIPHEDTTFTALKIGDLDVTPTGKIYKAGIYYGAPRGKGYYDHIQLASGSVVLVLMPESANSY